MEVRFERCRLRAVLFALGLFLQIPALAQYKRDPFDTGVVEQVGLSLMAVDVDVADTDGRPMPGLSLVDFGVQLDSRRWPIHTVQDLCPCAAAPLESATAEADAASPAVLPEGRPPAPDRVKFVLYIDFSQLSADGRVRATEEAKRWIRETMEPADAVMAAVHKRQSGLEIPSGFTSDKAKLLDAIDRSGGTDELADPRQRARSLRALKLLLERLQAVPGQKALVFFNQSTTSFPPGLDRTGEESIPVPKTLVDEVAAAAALARTRIYAAYSAEARDDWAADLGAKRADFNGAGRGCACVYRIGLEVPDELGERIHRLTVSVRGRALPETYRVQHLTAGERWMRAARAALSNPEQTRDIPVVAAVVPVAGHSNGWDVELQVALGARSILVLPAGEKMKGAWEVGAMLTDERTHRSWEMVGIAELHRRTAEATATAVLHAKTLKGLPPASYVLHAFIRARAANLYGSARAAIQLPPTGNGGIVGPLVRRATGEYLRTRLPLRAGELWTEPAAASAIESGPFPLGDRAVTAGEPLELVSWFCLGEAKDAIYDTRRFISKDGEALFRFSEPAIARAGDCARLIDRLETAALAEGSYTYHIRWKQDDLAEVEDDEALFEIVAATPVPAGN